MCVHVVVACKRLLQQQPTRVDMCVCVCVRARARARVCELRVKLPPPFPRRTQDPLLKTMLATLKAGGKSVFLLTNSLWSVALPD